MQLRLEGQGRFASEMKIIPTWAWALAAVGFVCAQLFFNVAMAREIDVPSPWLRILLGGLAGMVLAGYLLMIGYVSRDAGRRSMNSLLWIAMAILIPNGFGIILYFVLRRPLRRACPECGDSVQKDFDFCPRCSYRLSPSCPQCQRPVGVNVIGIHGLYCPYCGTALPNQPLPATPATA